MTGRARMESFPGVQALGASLLQAVQPLSAMQEGAHPLQDTGLTPRLQAPPSGARQALSKLGPGWAGLTPRCTGSGLLELQSRCSGPQGVSRKTDLG